MTTVSKKSLKPSKNGTIKIGKKVKSILKNESVELVSETNEIKCVETKEVQNDEDMEVTQSNENDKKTVLSNYNVQTPVPNKRVVIVKNINKDSKIDDVLAYVGDKEDIMKHSSVKVRNRGVKTQMLTIEFKTAHCTNGLINKLNSIVLDGSNLLAEYKYNLVDTLQSESVTRTDTFVIKNLPLSATKESVRLLIKDFDVSGKHIKLFKKFGKNCCFVKFNSVKQATEAFVIMKDQVVEGVKLEIKYVSEKKQEEEESSNTILHITNLPFTIRRETLEKEFDMADSIKFPLTAAGKSKGCCYLLFKSPEMAALAHDALQDKMIDARPIKCDYANKDVKVEEDNNTTEEYSNNNKPKRVRAKKDKNLDNTVTLFNLPLDVTCEEITSKFSEVASVDLLKNKNIFRGIANVVFNNKKSAMTAAKSEVFSIRGRDIRKELKGKKTKEKNVIKTKAVPMEL